MILLHFSITCLVAISLHLDHLAVMCEKFIYILDQSKSMFSSKFDFLWKNRGVRWAPRFLSEVLLCDGDCCQLGSWEVELGWRSLTGRDVTWWHHQMETFSALLAICAGNSPVTGEFPTQRPVTWSFDVFFDLRLNKRLSKQSWSWWFQMPSRPLWRHCNVWL